jgi:hypothetical protein
MDVRQEPILQETLATLRAGLHHADQQSRLRRWGGVFPANRVLGVDTWIGYPISGTLKWRHSAALRRHHIAGP